MPEPQRESARDAKPRSSPGSLRLRIWLACLGGAIAAGAALGWVIGSQIDGLSGEASVLTTSLIAAGGLGLLVGVILAVWLDHHVVGHLRRLERGIESGDPQALRDLPSVKGWGELSELARLVQEQLLLARRLGDAAAGGERLRDGLERLRERLESRREHETWEAPAADPALAPLSSSLERGFARDRELGEQNRVAVRLVREDLEAARDDAREAVEQAERGFVEATSLLTTVRELQRLEGELHAALSAPESAEAESDRLGAVRTATARAIEELAAASVESVDRLAEALGRVHEIVAQVRAVGNRATLIALHASLSGHLAAGDEQSELRTLARDVRVATERTEELSRSLEAEVQGASERMRMVRGRVADQLQQATALPASSGAAASLGETRHLLDRVREMIQDATRKGERLSSSGERSSRSAQRLMRRLDEQIVEFEGLAVRLGARPADAGAGPSSGARPLRLVPGAAASEESKTDRPAGAPPARADERP